MFESSNRNLVAHATGRCRSIVAVNVILDVIGHVPGVLHISAAGQPTVNEGFMSMSPAVRL